MSVVLAVEPDSSQTEALRKALRRLDAELMLVSTTRAAISAMDKSVPDLILVSALLSPRDEDALFAHLRSLDGSSHIQTLTIPQLRRGKASTKKAAALGRFRKKAPASEPAGCEPAVFAEQVSGYLARAHEAQRQFAEIASARANDLFAAIRQCVQPVEVERRVESEQLVESAQPNRPEPFVAFATLEQSAIGQPVVSGNTIHFESDMARLQPDAAGESVLLPDVAEASLPKTIPTVDQSTFKQPSPQRHDDSWINLDVEELAHQQLEAERIESPQTADEVQSPLSAEIRRFEEKAQQRRETELALALAEAQARLTAEVERVQVEAEARRQHELARVHAEAEAQRHAAVTQARAAAESEARSALLAELEQVQLSEIARVQAEADQRCDAAARQARETAEAEAARAMAEELALIRAQVEQTLNSQLAQARAEAEKMRETEIARAQVDAAALRDAAAHDARLAAEAAASRALQAEVARVRAASEARLQVELDTLRREAEQLRRADQSEADQAAEKVQKVHAAAVRDARAIAEAANQTLEVELLRVRAEADARLEAEVARERHQAERQRATELEEIRVQVAGMRETAAQQARRAAAQAIASEVVREAGESEVEPPAITATICPVESPRAETPTGDYYSLWKPPAEPTTELPRDTDSADTPKTVVALVRSKWALPVAAAILLVVGNGMSAGWSWRPRFSTPAPARVVLPVHRAAAPVASEVTVKTGELNVETDPPGARVLLDGAAAGHTPLTISKLKPGRYTLVLESSTGTLTRKVVVRAGQTVHVAEGIFSGWLAVFAGIPLNVYVGGQLRGTTEDGQLMLMAGSYNVELVSERFNYRETKSVTIEPGTVASYTVSLPTSVIRINSPDGTEISLDGQSIGRTPLGDLAVPIGTHEVAGTSAELGQFRRSIEVKLGGPAEVTLK